MTTITDLTKITSPGFTQDTLEEILRKKSGLTNVTVGKIHLGSVSKKGDSYLSTVTRFTVNGSGDNECSNTEEFQVHVIVKCIPTALGRAKSFRSPDFFANEIDFYNKVWPALDTFQKSKNLSKPYESIPLCLAAFTDGKNGFIALEDLSHQGFEPLDRTSGLDLNTTVFILKNFAKFHGISVAYREQNPKEFQQMEESLQETYFDERFRTWYAGTLNKLCDVVTDTAKQELPISYQQKIKEALSQDLYGNICKLLRKRTHLCAVTHGDCWPPNFLVQQSNDTKKIALIDFQLMRFTSLATDVLFLLCTCVDPLVRNNNWDFLLAQYHETFVLTLKELGSKLDVTFELFKDELKMYGLFAFGMCNEALIMSLMDDEDLADLDAIDGNEAVPLHEIWKITPIKNKEKRQRFADYLKHLIDSELI